MEARFCYLGSFVPCRLCGNDVTEKSVVDLPAVMDVAKGELGWIDQADRVLAFNSHALRAFLWVAMGDLDGGSKVPRSNRRWPVGSPAVC